MFSLYLLKTRRTSKAKKKESANNWLPRQAPFYKLKYGVVLPPLKTQDCWFFSSSAIQVIKLLLKPNLFNKAARKPWSQESKVFSTSIVTEYPPPHQYFFSTNFSNISDCRLFLLIYCLTV